MFGEKLGGFSAPWPVSTASLAARGSSQAGSVCTSSKPPGPRPSQKSSSGMFGEKLGKAYFGQTASVFGGRTSGVGGACFPAHTATASGPKQHHEQKGIFGIFSKEEGTLRRSSSVMEDISSKTTICVKEIPANLNKGSILRSHFSRFGRVMSTRCQPAKGTATIKFETHEGAAKAKKRGGKLPGQQKACTIFWRSSTTERSPSTTEDVASSKRPTWRTSPHKTASTAEAATVSSLYKMVGTTLMEKVNILNARDNLTRQILGKQVGSVNSKAFVGACPDMCPEKERLYREEVRRLSLYEIIPASTSMGGWTSQVDHTRAVKEYSRSSADQDEPLPHELRPTPVLMMTMNYLLQEIADQGEDGKWSEWYDFLCNRTRSIRKDITQQQLCSIDVVELLENCVRFHIYCSERLCMEDMMVFDEKINNENLTKCLQTLKELYHDMENKHGLFCPNEAEFRAYMVLMNLNEGDTLRWVQQLRPQVRDSPEIRFSIKMHSALNSNNYVRFFRLVKTASFLNACILHRYFNQIRGWALLVILRSYTAGAKKVGFPLQEIVRLLAFEREEEVREFCAYYGLLANGPDLVLDRSAYIEPESSIPAWRAVGLVESKRMVSVGEVINGKQLEPLQLPPPQCSFDEHGRFIGKLQGVPDAIAVSTAEEKVQPFAVKPITAQPTLQPSPLQLLDVSNDVVKMIARELFWEIIDESAHTIAESCVAFCQQAMASAGEVADQYVSSVSKEMARPRVTLLSPLNAEQASLSLTAPSHLESQFHQGQHQSSTSRYVSPSHLDSDTKLQLIEERLARSERMNERLFTILEKILQEQADLKQLLGRRTSTMEPDPLPEWIVLPLADVAALEDLERHLLEPQQELSVIHELSLVGGPDITSTTYAILNKVLDRRLAETFCWQDTRGDRSKRAFCGLHLKATITKAVRRTYKNATDHEIKAAVQDWFRGQGN